MLSLVMAAVLLPGAAAPCPCGKIEAYVDCSAAKSGKGGKGGKDNPYTSLGEVNALRLKAGDSIRLKRGVTCKGSLAPKGSGSASEPIVIASYGDGDAPAVIDATGAAQAVLLKDALYVRVTDLELTGGAKARGVSVSAEDLGTARGIELRNMDIHDVSAGVVIEAKGNATPTTFDKLKVAGNRIHATAGPAVLTWSNWCRRPEIKDRPAPDCTQAWAPIRRLTVEGNLLWNLGGAGISVTTAQDPVIRGNRLEGFGGQSGQSGQPGAGIAVANVKGAEVTGNDVAGGRGDQGGLAFELGRGTDGAVLEANLSHDNAGGFVRLCAARDFTVRGNLSVNDHARAYLTCDAPLAGGRIQGNTGFIGDGVDQLIVDAGTSEQLEVAFSGNLVTRPGPGKAGTVGWNIDSPGWTLDRNLLHGLPVPATATGTIKTDPALLAPGLADPAAYQVLAGSPVLGAAGTMPDQGGYPVSPAHVAAGSPNIGAVQAPAAAPVALAAAFDKDAAGKPPAGWQVSGAVAVAADPAGFAGNALAFARGGVAGTALRPFPATGGDLRVGARLRAEQGGQPMWLRVLGGQGQALADVGLSATGRIRYTDGGDVRDSGIVYAPKAWLPVSMVLHPQHGTYEISLGGVKVAEAKLTPGGGIAGQVAVVVPSGAGKAAFAVDDVLVAPELCVEKPATRTPRHG